MKNCKNGGKTIINLQDGPGSDPFQCECPHGYSGDLCEIGRYGKMFSSRNCEKRKVIPMQGNKKEYHADSGFPEMDSRFVLVDYGFPLLNFARISGFLSTGRNMEDARPGTRHDTFSYQVLNSRELSGKLKLTHKVLPILIQYKREHSDIKRYSHEDSLF